MKLKVAIAKIERYYKENNGFVILRNISTGDDLYIGPSWESEPLVMTKIGFTKEEREEEGWGDSDESELHHLGRNLSSQTFLIEEVTAHQWGVAFLDDCPITKMRDNVIHMKPGFDEDTLVFKV